MDRQHKNETPRRAGIAEPETCRILRFPARPPRVVAAGCGSGWYHQAAIDESSPPAPPRR